MLQLNDREPRENRGRLRHCNGIQTPRATGREIGWEGGSEVQTRSQDIGLAALVVAAPGRTGMLPVLPAGAVSFSVEEKDEASLLIGFQENPWDAFILRFGGV